MSIQKQPKETTFDTDAMIAEAIEQTGFNDFGLLPFRDGLTALADTYESLVLNPAGRRRCRKRLVTLLATRLRCEEMYKQVPAIEGQAITAPIFVVGLPRTATSALLNMFAVAPENRALLQWEAQFPDPWPGSEPGQEDPRYQRLVETLANKHNKAFHKIHYVDAETPEECLLLHAYAFSGGQLGFEIMFEPYRSWFKAQDLAPLYAYQLMQLKMLNWRMPGHRWWLKSPAHMWGIDAILEAFPDARFVWCHRDPKQVVPSISSMTRAVMGIYAGDCSHIDFKTMGRKVMDWYAESLERGLAAREKIPREIFVDCSQQEFIDEPLALTERIYGQFDLPFDADTRAALEVHVKANPKGKHGKHEYDLASFGLTEAIIADRFEFYTRDSRWPITR